MAKFEVILRKRNNPIEDLVDDLRRVAREIEGRRVTAAIYSEKGKFGVNTMLRRFGSWNAALNAAGLPINNIVNVPNDVLFENLSEAWQRLGRQPVGSDLNKANGLSKFSLGTYESRFGSWNKALQAFADFINRADTYDDAPILETGRAIGAGKRLRSSRKINWRLRAAVLIRDNCICQMCGASPSKDPTIILHVDHIRPWSKGGETTPDNLQTLCAVCNVGKSDDLFEHEGKLEGV